MKSCNRCDSDLTTDGRCVDVACPFSDHDQTCPVGWAGHPEYDTDDDPRCACAT